MPYLRWTEELCIGAKDVDSQHEHLVGLVNGLHDAMLEGRGKDSLGETIAQLIDYTTTHFATEEAYFERYGYPGAAAHSAEHRMFVEQVADFQAGFAEDRLMLSLDVMDFLGNWLVDHIQGSDRAYMPFLAEHGVV